MMTVKNYLDRSTIHGTGIFAGEDIKKGDLVWQFVEGLDRTIPREEFDKLPDIAKNFLRIYAYIPLSNPKVWLLEFDNGRFMNHSDAPNTDMTSETHCYAIRDIKKGEEFTCNYAEFDSVPEF